MKRKHREIVVPDEDSDSSPPPLFSASASSSTTRHRAKRARCTVLENGLAHLSIVGNHFNTTNLLPTYAPDSLLHVEEISMPPTVDTDMMSSSPILQPTYFVEEPPIPEVKMKVSSWYEPERDRIVITDLDSFTQSDDEEEEQEVTVNPALLEQIRSFGLPKATPAPMTSQALVLYKPLPRLGHEPGENEEHRDEYDEHRDLEAAHLQLDDDAMDIEP